MRVLTKKYKGEMLRYLERSQHGLLLNTKDVCRIAGIEVRDDVLANSCIDLGTAIIASAFRNMDFGIWMAETFAACDDNTPIDVACDDDWSVFRVTAAA
jgi:hypothetical protein